jgi:hypothetical protein
MDSVGGGDSPTNRNKATRLADIFHLLLHEDGGPEDVADILNYVPLSPGSICVLTTYPEYYICNAQRRIFSKA